MSKYRIYQLAKEFSLDSKKIIDILNKNKKCDNCGASNKSGDWIVSFKNETAYFNCKKCGFKKEVKEI